MKFVLDAYEMSTKAQPMLVRLAGRPWGKTVNMIVQGPKGRFPRRRHEGPRATLEVSRRRTIVI